MFALVLGGFHAFAGDDSYMLNSKEFRALSKDQQAQYIKSLQKILAEMTKRTLYMAEKTSQLSSSRMPASAIGSANNPSSEALEMDALVAEETAAAAKSTGRADPSNFSDPGANGFNIGPKNGKTKPKTSRANTESTPTLDSSVTPAAAEPVTSKAISVAATPASTKATASVSTPVASETSASAKPAAAASTPVVAKTASSAPSEPSKPSSTAATSSTKVITESKVQAASDREVTPAKKTEAVASTKATEKPAASAVKSVDAKASPAPASETKPTAKQDHAATPVAGKSDAAVKTTATDAPKKDAADPKKTGPAKGEGKTTEHNYRCMYSGWVVATDPCSAQDKFPDYYSIEGVDKSKMVCPGKTMCNPTVFGLNVPKNCKSLLDGDCAKKATPLCVKKGAWPTEDCFHLSTYKNAQIAAQINSEIDPAQFDHFKESFNDLCDPEKIKSNPFSETFKGQARTPEKKEAIQRDIRITCGWAKKQMALLKDTYDIDKMEDGKAKDEARKKWDASKPSNKKKQKSNQGAAQK